MNLKYLLLEGKKPSDIAKSYLETRKSEWENLMIPFIEEDSDEFREIQEKDNPDGTITLVGKTKNPSMMYKFIRIMFSKAFNAAKNEFYAPGLCRIFLDEFKGMNQQSLQNVADELTEIVKYIVKIGNEQAFGKVEKGNETKYKNFLGLSYNDLKNKFSNDIKKSNSDIFDSIQDKVQQNSDKKYNHYLIKDYTELEPFKKLITNPSDSWCIYNNEDAFDNYTNDKKHNFHLFVTEDAYKIERPENSDTAYDEYGLSCFAVIVKITEELDGKIIPSITNCTARYNHSVKGSADTFLDCDFKKIMEVTGCNKSLFLEGNKISIKEIIDSCTEIIFSEQGKCTVKRDKNHENYVVIDIDGNAKLYDIVYDFNEGLAIVGLNGKTGFVNTEGKEIVPCKYDDAYDFEEGFSMVILNEKYGFINKEGKEIVPCKYDNADSFKDGLAKVKLNKKYGYINTEGKEIVPCKYDNVYDFEEGFSIVILNEKYGFINKEGKEIVPCKYDYAYDFHEGLDKVRLNRKYGFVNAEGKEVIPCKYDYAYDFREGIASVSLNGKWGFVNKNGEEIIQFKYDDASSFKEGLASVSLNGKIGFINKNGDFFDTKEEAMQSINSVSESYNILHIKHLDFVPLFEEFLNKQELLKAESDYSDYKKLLTDIFNKDEEVKCNGNINQGRLHKLHQFSFDEYKDGDELTDDELETNELLDEIQENYEKAMSKHSDYLCNLKSHISRGCGLVYFPFDDDDSCLVGFQAGSWSYDNSLLSDIFIVSHFAPSSMKKGYELIKYAANESMPIVFAVPNFLSIQLEKAGFKFVCTIKQYFNGEYVDKNVMINNAVTDDDLNTLISIFKEDDDNYQDSYDDNYYSNDDYDESLQDTEFEDVK